MSSGRIPLDTVIDAFETMGLTHEPVTASEIAEELECSRRTAYKKLDQLADRGDLHSKKVGARGRVWWRPANPDSRAEESERDLSTLMDNLPCMVYRCRNERGWPMEFVSDGCRDLIGYESNALERGEVSYGEDIVVDADRAGLWMDVKNAVDDQEPFLVIYRIETASGDVRWVRERGRGVFNDDGEVAALEGVIIDVTEHKHLETEFEELFERISDAFYALNADWQFTHVNECAEELIDYQGEGLVGKNFWEVFEWAEDSKLGDEYRTAMETQESTTFEFYYPEPLDAWYEVHAYPSETGLSVYFQEITERKEREQQLRQHQAYTDAVFDAIDDIFYILDESGDLRRWNHSLCEVTGYQPDEIESMHALEFFDEDTHDKIIRGIREGFETGNAQVEAELLTKDGDQIPFEFVASTLEAPDGNQVLVGIGRDMTESREYQRQLEESERRYRALAENFPNGGVGVYDCDLRYTLVTGTMWDDIDLDAADLEGSTIWEALPPDTADDVEPLFRAALDGETDSVVSTLGGRTYRVWATPLPDADGRIIAGQSFALDITDRIERERELEQTERQFEATFNNPSSFMGLLDPDGTVRRINEAALEFAGIEEETVRGEKFWETPWFTHSEEVQAELRTGIDRAADGEYVRAEIPHQSPEGDVAVIDAMLEPVHDDREVVAIVPSGHDITERKEYEQRLERQNERLESFASMLAHELRNPVTIGQIYSGQLPADEDSDAVEYVREAFDRIEDMVDVMLVLTRGDEAVGERTWMDLAEAAETAWDQLDAPDATVSIEIDSTIQGDETYIRHLFRNLFENAVEHGGRNVTISVGELPTGFYVADDGAGIPVENREAVFEAGFTTAMDEGGTGLGLAFVRELADVYDWECSVTESAGGGARFEFRNVDSKLGPE